MASNMTLEKILDMSWDWRAPVLMMMASEAGVFDAAAGGWKNYGEIADRLGADRRATRLLLTALSGAGLVEKSGDNFKNSDAAERHLVKGSPEYRGHIVKMNARGVSNWLRIPEVLKTGEPIPKPEQTKREADEWQRVFISAMDALSFSHAEKMLEALPTREGMKMLDIGCGPATYMIHFAKRLSGFTATAFDRPASEPVVREAARKAGVEDRVAFIGGDCLTFNFEGEYDGVLISQLLHIMSSEQSAAIVSKAADVTKSGGFVAVHEMTLGPDEDPGPSALFATQMMLGTKEGAVYTVEEISGWLRATGLKVESAKRVSDRSEVIVGRKF